MRNVESVVTGNCLARKVRVARLLDHLLLEQAQHFPIWTSLLKTAIDQLEGVPLKRQVVTETVFSTQRPATRGGGVDADAVQIDILRILDEVARERGKRLRRGVLLGRGRIGRVVDLAADVRQAAVVLDVIETQLGIIQGGYVPAQRYTKLILGIF